MPYLIVPKAHAFMTFMKTVFGAMEQVIVPCSEGMIMHGELRIGDAVIMFADSTDPFSPGPAGIFIYVENVWDTYQKAIDPGGRFNNGTHAAA